MALLRSADFKPGKEDLMEDALQPFMMEMVLVTYRRFMVVNIGNVEAATIAVVATDAALSPAGCRRVAVAAQDGLARTIRPCHTPLDGDTVFALATGAVEVVPDPTTPASMSPEVPLITAVGAAAADCLARAVLVGVLAAEELAGIPTYRGLLPGAFE